MENFRVGILGATGMVGQRFVRLLENHPWFRVTALAASPRSAGKPYREAVGGRWAFDAPIPEYAAQMTVLDASDVETIAAACDFVFCAVDMKKDEVIALEERYARAEVPVISNNSAARALPDVPMMIPEINGHHAAVIETQRRRLGTQNGFIAVKPNCSIQCYVPALWPLLDFQPSKVCVSTYQAISGAGKTFKTMPEMVDNVIPYIGGEDEKSEREPLKIFGRLRETATGVVVENAREPVISATCVRVPVTDGHLATVSVSFRHKPTMEEILERWRGAKSPLDELALPTAPSPFLIYLDDADRPQTRLDRDAGGGMAVTIGRLRPDSLFDYKFVCLSHNTLRGAAGGGLLSAEYLCRKGFIAHRA